MSIAVAVRKGRDVVLACDTLTVFGASRVRHENHRACKIRKIGSAYMATTGWGLYENIFNDLLRRAKNPVINDASSIFAFFMRVWKALHAKYSFVNDQSDRDADSPFGDLDAAFLVVNARGIFYVAGDMSVTAFDEFYAIGSGSDFSLGALHALYDSELDAEALARRAVQAAIDLNIYCGGEIDVAKKRIRSAGRGA